MTKLKVLVTGGSGIVGHYVIDELYKQGHTVLNADKVRLTGNLKHSGTTGQYASASAAIALRDNWPRIPEFFEVDVTDYGQVISAMANCDAVIALASRPSASYYVEEDVVRTNTMSMWNVCRAAEQLKINQLVLGSSYNAIGAMGTAQRWEENQVKPPNYFPVDQHSRTRAEDPYSVSKWLGEEIADPRAIGIHSARGDPVVRPAQEVVLPLQHQRGTGEEGPANLPVRPVLMS